MMRPSGNVADKAVSTEDLQREYHRVRDEEEGRETVTNTAFELTRLEAVLTALVETKVIAIKAATGKTKKPGGRFRSLSSGNQGRLQRLTSSSTASSSHQDPNPPSHNNNNHHHDHHQPYHHHHHHHHYHNHHHHKRKRQSDSALLSSGLLFPKKRYRHHYIKAIDSEEERRCDQECEDCKQTDNGAMVIREEDVRTKSATNLAETDFGGIDCGSRYSLDEDMIPGPSTSCQNSPFHTGYHSCHSNAGCKMMACSPSPTNSQSKILVPRGEADHISLNMATDEEEEEAAKRRKRKRRRRNRLRQESADQGRTKRQKRIDPEDLPKRARWTIIATACLLLLMSVLLVGVTLRMAPIIDEMVRKENEQLLKSMNRDDHLYNVSPTASTLLDSTKPSQPPD